MKKTVVIMLIAAALAGAETLWENPWDIEQWETERQSSGDYHCQDDFVLNRNATIESFTCWCDSEAGMTDNFELKLFTDNGGSPGTQILYIGIVDYDIVPTGDGFWGIDMPLQPPIEIDAGVYWVEFYYAGVRFLWAVGADGNMYQNGLDTGFDGFFGVYGEWGPEPAVAECSWGAIKALGR